MTESRFKRMGRWGPAFTAPSQTESAPESAPDMTGASDSAQNSALSSAPESAPESAQSGAPNSALRAALEEKLSAEPEYKSRGLKIRPDILEVIDGLPKGRGKQQIIVNEALEIGLKALGFIASEEDTS